MNEVEVREDNPNGEIANAHEIADARLSENEADRTLSKSRTLSISENDYNLLKFCSLILFTFMIAFFIWWVSNFFFNDTRSQTNLGFWAANDAPGWLPANSGYGPLLGNHYFGDFFQFYYLIRSHIPYTGKVFYTSVNPGYLLPAYLVSWLPYRVAGFVYMTCFFVAWIIPSFLIWKRQQLLGFIFLTASTLTMPFLYALSVGQPQIFMYLLAVLFLLLIDRRPILASIFLGITIAIKPYMAIFACIYLWRREYVHALRASITAAVLNLGGAVIFAGAAAFTAHFWIQILKGFYSYGSGNQLAVWDGVVFLKNNASLFAFVDTLARCQIPFLSTGFEYAAINYTYFAVALTVVFCCVLYYFGSRLRIEMQWILLTCFFLLVPSYTLGYAWTLLLVPIAVSAIHGSDSFASARTSLVLVLIAFIITFYPSNINRATLPSPHFGPDGNTLLDPILLVVLTIAVCRTSSSSSEVKHTVKYLGTDEEHRYGFRLAPTIVMAILLQVAAVLWSFALS